MNNFKSSLLILPVVLIFTISINESRSQTVIRQCISPYGKGGALNSIMINQTVGQPYFTATSFDKGYEIRYNPGFQQNNTLIGQSGKEEDDNQKSSDDVLSNLMIYPNPASDIIHIGPGNRIENVYFKVINNQGNVVFMDKNEDAGEYTINCNTWSNGIYFIIAYNKQNYHSYKILIIK